MRGLVANQLPDAVPLRGVVFNHEKLLRRRRCQETCALENSSYGIGIDRFLEQSHRTVFQCVPWLTFGPRNDENSDMTGI